MSLSVPRVDWGVTHRLKFSTKSVSQLEFVLVCFPLGEIDKRKKMTLEEAADLMTIIGTAWAMHANAQELHVLRGDTGRHDALRSP